MNHYVYYSHEKAKTHSMISVKQIEQTILELKHEMEDFGA